MLSWLAIKKYTHYTISGTLYSPWLDVPLLIFSSLESWIFTLHYYWSCNFMVISLSCMRVYPGMTFPIWRDPFLNWSIVDLEYCVHSQCTAEWFSYMYICSFLYFVHYDLLQDIECGSLCYTMRPCHLSILYKTLCIF